MPFFLFAVKRPLIFYFLFMLITIQARSQTWSANGSSGYGSPIRSLRELTHRVLTLALKYWRPGGWEYNLRRSPGAGIAWDGWARSKFSGRLDAISAKGTSSRDLFLNSDLGSTKMIVTGGAFMLRSSRLDQGVGFGDWLVSGDVLEEKAWNINSFNARK